MDPTVVTVIVVVVLVLLVVGLLAMRSNRKKTEERREHLQDRFGPEYDRAVADADDRRQAEARLHATEKRREELDIRPLTAESRARRVQEWDKVQAMFVDAPVEAVDHADRLVADVMAERGYPSGDLEDKLTLLAADHAGTVEHYRTAESHRERFHSGAGSTEDLRRAFVEYRSLFDVLVREGADTDRPVAPVVRPDDRADAGPGMAVDRDVDGRDDRTDDRVHDRTDEPTDDRTMGSAQVDLDRDGRDDRTEARPVGQHAARTDVDEVDLRDRRDPSPTATPVEGSTGRHEDGR